VEERRRSWRGGRDGGGGGCQQIEVLWAPGSSSMSRS
jgi:hypothetical protein